MDLRIVPMAPGAPEAAELIEALSAELARRTGADGRSSFRAEEVAQPRSIFLVAFAGEQAVGCGALRPLDDATCELKRMYARYPGRGIGCALLQALERYAHEFGYARIWLETRAVNSQAVSFYLRHGYAVRPNYGKYVGNLAAICFEKLLEPSSPLDKLGGSAW